MKRLIFRYFSLLFLFLVIGVNLFGSENSKGEIPVPDKENIEKASDKFQEFSSRQVVASSSRIQFSLSFHKRTELISRKSEFQTLEGKNYKYFSDLLGLRHLQGFYVFDLCKIII